MSSIFYAEMGSMIITLMGVLVLGSFLFSVTLCLVGQGLFFKLEKRPSQALIPVYNLLVLTEGLEKNPMSTFLYFVPFINLIYYINTIDTLGYVFKKDYDFRLGLALLPVVFVKILSSDKSTLTRFEEIRINEENHSVATDMLLLDDDAMKELNEQESDDVRVNSIFKAHSESIPKAEQLYKAKETVKRNNLDFDKIEGKHKIIFIPSPRDEARREDIIKKVETSYIGDVNKNFNHQNDEIDIYEIK